MSKINHNRYTVSRRSRLELLEMHNNKELAAAVLLLLCVAYCVECAQMITISPNCTQEDDACYSLSKLYADNPESLKLPLDITIVFQSGVHSMTSDIVIRDVDNVTLQFEEYSQIRCVERAELVFMNITNLQIFGLTMNNCGAEINESLATEALFIQTETVITIENGLQATIFAVNIRRFQMDHAMINGSHGYGFLGINIIGESSVANTLINSSNTNSLTDYCMTPGLTISEAAECLGANALFVYNDFPECPARRLSYMLTIVNSTFSHGFNPIGAIQNYVSQGCGLGIVVYQKYYDIQAKVINSTFINNTAKSYGSNIYIRLYMTETNSSVSIYNSHMLYGRSDSDSAPDAIPYSSLVFLHGLYETSLGNHKNCSGLPSDITSTDPADLYPQSTDSSRRQVLLIENSEFYNNIGGAIYVVSFTSLLEVLHTYTVLIRNCTFRENIATRASAMYVLDISSENTKLLEMTVEDSVIKDHTTAVDQVHSSTRSSVNLISSVKRFIFRNCLFTDNSDSVLLVYDSNIYFEGKNIFKNNKAKYGGAAYLAGNSIIYLPPNTRTVFDGNSALERGGALYLTGGNEVAYFFNCQIQVFDPSFMDISKLNITMKFINNTAVEAGDALYGGRIDLCFALAPSQFLYRNQTLKGTQVFNSVTDFSEQPHSSSYVSSDAEKICFCFDDVHNCSTKNLTLSKYPGEVFKLSVVGIGQRDGTVPAVVQTQFNNLQKTRSSCTNALYRVSSLNSMEELYLTASTARANSPSPLLVTVNLLECDNLVGFSLGNESSVCDCEPKLKERGITCNIDSRVITRQPPYWLSNYSNHLLLHDNCPYDYCKPGQVQIVMTEPNISEQCAFNRYGTLCGSCKEGFSHVFGSSRCRQCSNKYLSLLLPFALAGIALVVFLFALDLTVSIGTINGLIFYANIIKINETIFFPAGDSSFFRAFISWLNLDLGIETCFYSGMDSLGKTWLQFTFPFYLWIIVLIIIVLFRYSPRLTKLCGNHSVPVLATIFLLSFTKLLRTVTKVFDFTTLVYPTGRRAVWLYDGNIWYARDGHLALFLFSLIFLLAIAIPYTLLILTVQILRKYSHKRFLRWVNKFMPIFDAYLGPYKNKQGYWTGLLLLVRVILVAVFTANVFGNSAINVFFVLIIAIFLILLNLGQGGVYKRNILTALELSYIVNLALLAAATALVNQIYEKQERIRPVIYTSCTVALVTFIGTLVYHVKVQVMRWCKSPKRENEMEQENYEILADGNSNDNRRPQEVTTTLIEISRDNY